jgi:hypothetical protein
MVELNDMDLAAVSGGFFFPSFPSTINITGGAGGGQGGGNAQGGSGSGNTTGGNGNNGGSNNNGGPGQVNNYGFFPFW